MNHTHHATVNPQDPQQAQSHRGHGWMMLVMCLPMVLIAAALVGTGIVSGAFLLFAIACAAMMFFMMKGMSQGGSSRH